METTTTFPAWATDVLADADRRFEREADELRIRLYGEALTEAMREHTPVGLPDLTWRANRWSDGTIHVWAYPQDKSFICLFPDEIRESAAVFACWLAELEGPAMTEAPPLRIEGYKSPALVFEAPRRLASIDFTLSFRPWIGQLDADQIRRIVAEAVAA